MRKKGIQILNGTIRSTHIGNEDHGIPTFNVDIDFGGSCQGFGGYDLRAYGIKPIVRIVSTVGADSWEDLVGKNCRVKREGGLIRAIGHIVEDVWYDIQKEGTQL